MNVHIERFNGGIIRVFANGETYGSKYIYTLPFKLLDNDPMMFEFVGVIQPPTPSQYREIARHLRSLGIRGFRERKSGANIGYKEL